jgi:hypothetical protein
MKTYDGRGGNLTSISCAIVTENIETFLSHVTGEETSIQNFEFWSEKKSVEWHDKRTRVPTLQNGESMVLAHVLSPETTINLDHYIHTLRKLKTQIIQVKCLKR